MILRYYQLTSHTEEVLSALEKNILGNVAVPEAPPSDFPGKAVSLPVEILYRSLEKTDSGKRSWFKKDVSPTYKKKLVLRLDENHVSLVDRYLYTLALEVEEARVVSCAALTFATNPAHSEAVDYCKTFLESHIQANYPRILVEVGISKKVLWDKESGDVCQGILSGPVEEIIELNGFLGSAGWGTSTKRRQINFFYKHNHQE